MDNDKGQLMCGLRSKRPRQMGIWLLISGQFLPYYSSDPVSPDVYSREAGKHIFNKEISKFFKEGNSPLPLFLFFFVFFLLLIITNCANQIKFLFGLHLASSPRFSITGLEVSLQELRTAFSFLPLELLWNSECQLVNL